MAVDQLLALEGGQTTQLHVEDRLCLDLVDPEHLDQPVPCHLHSGRGADQGDDLIQEVKGFEQATQDVRLFLRLAQAERRPSPDDVNLVVDPVPNKRTQGERARHTVDQRQHVGTERGLQLGVLVEVVEHDLGDSIPFEHDHQTLAGTPRRLVPDVGDPRQTTFLDELGDLLREAVRVDLVGQLGHHQTDAVLNLLDHDHGAHDDGAAPRAIGVLDALAAQDERPGGEVRSLDLGHHVREELLAYVMTQIQGPDFPTGALILGRKGIEDAYRTGRGSIIMRAVVEVEEIQNRICLVVTELPYQVNPDSLAQKIAELVKEGRLAGIADIRDETSGRTGQRLVIVLKRDAVAKVVLNNLYKHTQLQTTFGANMLALVDGVPRTLPLSAFIRHWVEHQMDVIRRRTAFRLRKAEEEAHILRGLLKALDALDEVISLIRASATVEVARDGLIQLLGIDELQAQAILNMQLVD